MLARKAVQTPLVNRIADDAVGDGFWQDVDTPGMLVHAEAALGV